MIYRNCFYGLPEGSPSFIGAKYIIDNTKNNQGKVIKNGNITIANVAAILEAYDRMTKHGK